MTLRRVMHKAVRESAFRLARYDLAMFLRDHEQELLDIFRDELQRMDDEIPEENLFIDIKMVPLGETSVKAVLRAMHRFLVGDIEGAKDAAVEQIPDDQAISEISPAAS